MSRLISTYAVRDDGKVVVKTPYAEPVVDQCRKWSGKFDKDAGGWLVAGTRLADVQAQLGADLSDVVEVETGKDDLTHTGAQYLIGWYVVAARRGRDSAADVYAELVAGEIPPSGGSMKNPWVKASDDARFRLWVARDFAAARNLTVVTDPKAAAAVATVTDAAAAAAKTEAVGRVLALMAELGVTVADL